MSPSNSTDATKSTDGNIGSNDATTEFMQISSESSVADTSSTDVNMGSTEAGSTKINTESTAANTSPTGANTESTVSEISSTQATTGSTAAATTANPVLSLAEVLNSSSAVYIRNAGVQYLIRNGSTSDADRGLVFVRSIPGPTSESCWRLVSAQDGNPNHIYIKSLQNYIWYTSIYEKDTFNMGNKNNFVECADVNNPPPGKICINGPHITYVWIPGNETPEEILEIIPSGDKSKIRSIYNDFYHYASGGDVTSVRANDDATDENLMWTFELCEL